MFNSPKLQTGRVLWKSPYEEHYWERIGKNLGILFIGLYMKKSFDCVEMKNRIQQELRKEYEKRKAEFSSYADFINATAGECEEVKEFRNKLMTLRQSAHSKTNTHLTKITPC